ncbi:MAG: helix-turn-helix transcriptional regulator [Eggerthellaceae bacterium]|nr:helix-turn-helix transcriptional regulator [Eggerthellaceae bacterium]
MRAFVIADAYKRKARPIGALLWKPDSAHAQGRFVIEMASWCEPRNVPLSLSFCLGSPNRRASERDSEKWVKSRIVPENRHNISEVLLANNLTDYNEVALLAANMGRSSDDDFATYEVVLPEGLQQELEEAFEKPLLAHEPIKPGGTAADKLIAATRRRRSGSGISYAIVSLPDLQTSTPHADAPPTDLGNARSAAQHIGAQVKSRRQSAGFTQKQLAARAGITQTVLSRVESGAGNPTLGLLEDIAAALGTTLSIGLAERTKAT